LFINNLNYNYNNIDINYLIFYYNNRNLNNYEFKNVNDTAPDFNAVVNELKYLTYLTKLYSLSFT